ncbi:UvrB/UvrC motif-containing protein [Terribacillus saccharophilus]|uniref:UVR domain-containing protein n=1 Tax=Terribacillus saccharophilus TaxID=361277 RepID=A0A268A6T4_9BACI|nr:UvrB/UvrC motif-containing protein [Terribacillus saccharophilus]PAD19830.1 hypothetical protein CHH64_17440 [Terribacillus saccharophilus]PAF16455.1 hypothetical protein CHH51_16880 [Terribacillus saccharophilus]PAF20145.1 hypothetical protein CHH49_17300 [Terribacillus saccharophilus]PAF35286.1 hypothetical protein CHH58_17580 [Terribacillus saccharophilus]PAF36097.1 hypothetical protein CHH69_11130 [Terribacillus saccharophilus]
MECQECHIRPATLHLTNVVNGQKTEMHVCEHCAKENGYVSYGQEGYSLHNLLSGLFHMNPSTVQGHKHFAQAPAALACPKCGLTYNEFTRLGKFGCASCYETFEDNLNPIFRRVHSGNTKHEGKIPKRMGSGIEKKRKIAAYRESMQQYIQEEEFEKAAELRDKIRSLEQQKDGQEEGES